MDTAGSSKLLKALIYVTQRRNSGSKKKSSAVSSAEAVEALRHSVEAIACNRRELALHVLESATRDIAHCSDKAVKTWTMPSF